MSDPAINGIHLTKDYYKDFLPTDLQWNITEIDEDFTLYDLFMIIDHAQQMIPGIPATMGMLNFDNFFKQIQLDRDTDDDEDVQYLELYWRGNYDTRITKKTGKYTDQSKSALPIDQTNNYWDEPQIASLSNLMSFHGIGQGCPGVDIDCHECGDDCPETSAYAIEFSPLNNLAHLPIRVSPRVEFYPPYVECDKEFHRTGFQLDIKPTLWCFITSILWELTFAGSDPNEISAHRESLQDGVKEAQQHFENMDEEDEDYPFVD